MPIATQTIYRLTQPHLNTLDTTDLSVALSTSETWIGEDPENTPVYVETLIKITAA